ncbi:MAG: alpha-L-fucosidase [Planctomycetota bacterium]
MMQPWFPDAKFGLFMHWGLYSVKGISESWSFFNGQISHEDYFAQRHCFGAEKYDPKQWAELFARVGAKYAVLTTKHHDGFALWPTAHHAENSFQHTPAAKQHDDLIGPYCDALREHGLRVGLYFSHLDWSHPDFPSVFNADEGVLVRDHPGYKYERPLDSIDKPEKWAKFLEFHRAQLKELSDRYSPDLFWFDGSWTHNSAQWDMKGLRDQLHAWNPQGVVLNSRMGKNPGYGDYDTPEQGVPVVAPKGPWEFCVTLNNSWGWVTGDESHKSVRQIVRLLCDTVGMGGNLLLAIGPYADGRLQPTQVERLEALGDWLRPRAEAIYGTTAGATHDHFLGSSTLSADRKTLFLFQYDRPVDGIAIKGLRNRIERATVLGGPGHGTELTHRVVGMDLHGIPALRWIEVPDDVFDPITTCIKLELDEALDLYSEAGAVIEAN